MNANIKKHQIWVRDILKDSYREFLKGCSLEIKKTIGNKVVSFKHFLIKDIDLLYPFEELNVIKDGSINDMIPNFEEDITVIGHDHNSYSIDNKNILICLGSSGLLKDDNTFYFSFEDIDDKLIIKRKNVKYDRKKFESIMKIIDYPDKNIIGKNFFGIEETKESSIKRTKKI